MEYTFSQNLIFSQPPLFLFAVCLAAFGLTMVVLAYTIGAGDFPNPDVSFDLNKPFRLLTKLKLCPLPVENKRLAVDSGFAKDSLLNLSSSVVDESQSISAALSNVVHQSSEEFIGRVKFREVSVKVQIKMLGESQPVNMHKVKGKIRGNLLGFNGKYSTLLFNISLDFLNSTSCSDKTCKSLWDVCARISIPLEFLSTIKLQESCTNPLGPLPQIYSLKNEDSPKCIPLEYISNSKLTERLSLHDRSIIHSHLMHTSCFLFVMVMTLICCSLIKGKYRPLKKSHCYEKGLINT